MAFNVQKNIRDNATELQDFLKDLKDWEKQMKEKDVSLKNQSHSQEKLPPVRGCTLSKPVDSVFSKPTIEPSSNLGKESVKSRMEKVTNQSSSGENRLPHAAGHTYDYFKNKWDEFDVDVALKEVDEDAPSASKSKVVTQREAASLGQVSSNKKPFLPSSRGSVGGQTVVRGQSATLDRVSQAWRTKESPPDAISEKELGNEFFKEKKYVQAIECYSRSIALQPTAVAYANRAMAFLKIGRFEEAEVDCTEAISLDDRYTKAYSRRGTARRELKNYLEAVEDHEFALRLEPQNKELQTQYSETKRLFEKEVNLKPSEEKVPLMIKTVMQGPVNPPTVVNTSSSSNISSKPFQSSEAVDANSSLQTVTLVPTKVESKNGRKQEIAASVQAAAARAAAAAMTSVSRNMVAPKTSYEFETMWKGLAGDRLSQIMDPLALPKLFKDSLGAPLLVDIIQTLGLLCSENLNLAIQILESLTRVGRFNMTILFLTPKDKAALKKLWDEVFTTGQIPIENLEQLESLRGKYRL
ncbi:hypothetical protein O6H91_02G062600 [Diphasiastrum complanatum]|uniref:Uncharacterized protein n=1 Tax=Diphasiastrum complanatum TaxID=34168 RepID=A0ACC2EGN9_DIPCM|nr:hypothetical protein O6H91_02G062600 [Diphasiastrum complanatum]